ncbi:MAG: hypothetical protein COW18_11115 [Zetaproteobacteria bacterium CG12_big_fil_rev_8_21_14_0_65_54_13]|nr:MAG: hypothetical protein COW18_11115 [Zetaproteobacteria bacterium CG12_big_fil_rev_8_21_14_0_65_54_13]PIX55639.1 MAG: hypothetical protein COZ50_01580 [Zetaproteobacteria bacterium CG_4_10_14_3_um_filter_54_28]PJA30647.1 MAG: hypothetical protein CO188_02470 [Zetaproteobacteria bacterium CG_4_9_14_3_um_filter_54_145]
MKSYRLSKSKVISGMQCPKRLWLQVHKPDLIEVDYEENLPMLNGNEVGEMARRLFPGTLVKYEGGLSAALAKTEQLVADPDIRIIHEATFCHQGMLVRVDILERSADAWILTEVKGATSVKPHYIPDAAVQAWVVQSCGLRLESVRLMYVNNQFVYQGNGEYHGLLVADDISSQTDNWLDDIDQKKAAFITMLNGDEPAIEMGDQCNDPYACEFCCYCQPDNMPEYPVTVLPRLLEPQKGALMADYADVRDIPETALSNPNHLRVWRATRAGREEIICSEMGALKQLPWPRYYLDSLLSGQRNDSMKKV